MLPFHFRVFVNIFLLAGYWRLCVFQTNKSIKYTHIPTKETYYINYNNYIPRKEEAIYTTRPHRVNAEGGAVVSIKYMRTAFVLMGLFYWIATTWLHIRIYTCIYMLLLLLCTKSPTPKNMFVCAFCCYMSRVFICSVEWGQQTSPFILVVYICFLNSMRYIQIQCAFQAL